MKTKKPDRSDGREERIVALLAGEVSPKEATELRRLMESEPSLMEFYNRMNRTMDLVRAAQAAEGGAVEEPKLSESRRGIAGSLQTTGAADVVRETAATPVRLLFRSPWRQGDFLSVPSRCRIS
jgi:anti-sigma factor RsiW